MTPCKCQLAGYCKTHKREMDEHNHRMCQNEPGYYEAFQKSKPKPRGLGDVVEEVLVKTGVASVVKKIAGENCGCGERRDKLNEMFPFEDEK